MAASILVVEDDEGVRESLCDTLTLAGLHVRAAGDGAEALRLLDAAPADLVVSDVQMAPMDGITLLRELKRRHATVPVLLMTAFGTVQQAVAAMRDGAEDYLLKPFEAEVVVSKIANLLDRAPAPETGLVAEDPAMRHTADIAARIAASEVSVLLEGESGTGKEVMARYIHRHSARRDGPFVAINCAAIPDNMLEAILFGYEKGAFTGAHKACPGKFEQAQGGTLLLDEVTEMEPALQAKLLRVLQEREVERLGGRDMLALDIRVIATSNRDIRQAVAEGAFRGDLYYRLAVFPLRLPALRERPADIIALAQHLLARAAAAAGSVAPVLGEDAGCALRAHAWPGNVRELDNVMQRALVLCAGERVSAAALHLDPGSAPPLPGPAALPAARSPATAFAAGDAGSLDEGLKAREYRLILEALEAERGRRKEAAERLGISPRTLRYKLARMRDDGMSVPG